MKSGPEMMIDMLLKGMGIEPEKMKATFDMIANGISNVAARMDQLATNQIAIKEQLDRLELLLSNPERLGYNGQVKPPIFYDGKTGE